MAFIKLQTIKSHPLVYGGSGEHFAGRLPFNSFSWGRAMAPYNRLHKRFEDPTFCVDCAQQGNFFAPALFS
jgi:hypothetical protein